MPRDAIWKSIAVTLSSEISAGHYLPGDKLPTESELSARFGVNRHTVRRALGELTSSGMTYARRGAGVFVTATSADYAIGRRVRFHRNVAASGRTPSRRILSLETRRADADEAEALDIPVGSAVHVFEGLSLADGVPLASFRSVFPADRFGGLLTQLRESGSVTAALKAAGLDDYTRASTRLTATSATSTLALHLRIADGAPILRSVAVNIDPEGRPVEYGVTWFAGDKVTLTVSPET